MSRPVATYTLIALNAVVFVAQIATTGRGYGSLAGGTFTDKLQLYGPAVADGEWWRLVTGGFLHAGFFHIAINMYILWMLGSLLEPAVGIPRFLLIYFVSLLAGSFGALVVTPHSPTVGASGAIFGIAGAAVVLMRNRGVDLRATGLPLFIGINLVIGFAIPGISVGGHIGGLIGGALAALALVEVPHRLRGVPWVVPAALAAPVGAAAVVGSLAVASPA